jgi:hypothetical protein
MVLSLALHPNGTLSATSDLSKDHSACTLTGAAGGAVQRAGLRIRSCCQCQHRLLPDDARHTGYEQ